jgi:hypothetical protein
MDNQNITLDYKITIPVLKGTATLTVREWSFVLSEKSLYGAGETRFKNQYCVTYNDGSREDLEITSNFIQEKQNIFQDGVDKDAVATDFIIESISNYLFDVTDELDEEMNRYAP